MKQENVAFQKFTGILSEDSPAAHFLILRSFSIEAANKLSKIYSEIAQKGALKEPAIRRKPGVRFNPLPARIIHILLTETPCRDLDLIETALAACASKDLNSIMALSRLPDNLYQENPYLCVFLLDALRHLHLNNELEEMHIEACLETFDKMNLAGIFSFWPRVNLLISNSLRHARRIFAPC